MGDPERGRVAWETGNPKDHPSSERKKENESFAGVEPSISADYCTQEHYFGIFAEGVELFETQDEGNFQRESRNIQ